MWDCLPILASESDICMRIVQSVSIYKVSVWVREMTISKCIKRLVYAKTHCANILDLLLLARGNHSLGGAAFVRSRRLRARQNLLACPRNMRRRGAADLML